MRKSFVLLVTVASFSALTGIKAASSPRRIPPAICTIDSLRLAYTFHQIEVALAPTNTGAEHLARLDSMGLKGVRPSDAVIVVDAAKCAAARSAYLKAKQPKDRVIRAKLAQMVPSVILVRLSPTRFLMNSGVDHYWTTNEFWLFDARFTTIPFLFY